MKSLLVYILLLRAGDFLNSSQTSVTLSPQIVHCVAFTTVDDVILEEDEAVDFSVSADDPAILRVLPDNGQITIVDNDRKSI